VLEVEPPVAIEPPDAEEPPEALFDAVVESFVLDAPPPLDCAPEDVAVVETVSELSAVPPLAVLVVAAATSFSEPLELLVADVSPLLVLVVPPSLPSPQLARPTHNETVTKFLIDMTRIVLPFVRVNFSCQHLTPGMCPLEEETRQKSNRPSVLNCE
jgi:hypothetical protein